MTLITTVPTDWHDRLVAFWETNPACDFCLRVEQLAPATQAFLRFDPEHPDDIRIMGLCTPCTNCNGVR